MLPPAEIVFEGFSPGKMRVVDYRAKWVVDSFEYNHTPRNFEFLRDDDQLLERLSELCLECWRLFGLHGWARVDFRVDSAGRPWILEVNTNPCLASDAGFMAAAGRAGLDMAAVAGRIINDAVRPEGGGHVSLD